MVIGRTAGSVWSSDVAPGRSTAAIRKLRNKPLDRIVQLEAAVFEQQQRGTGCNQLGIGKDAEYVVDPQGYLRFLVGPPDAVHIHQIPTDEHRGRESGQKIPIDVPLHGSVRRPKVMVGGGDFHVFHDLARRRAEYRLYGATAHTIG